MGVYHITYAPELREVCLYFDGRCNFSCRGCITDSYPLDCHLDKKDASRAKNITLDMEEAASYLKHLSFEKVIFLGKDDPLRVLNNFLKYAYNHNIKVRAESIFIPGYIDDREIEKIAKFISSVDSTIPYRIDGYIPYSPRSCTQGRGSENGKFRRPTKDEMKEAKSISEKYLQNVSILYFGTKVKHRVKKIY